MKIYQLKSGVRGVPLKNGASSYVIFKGGLRGVLGKFLSWIGIPRVVSDVEIADDVTGQRFSVKTGARFTIISVDGRDYYFRRLSGKYDGTGQQAKCD